MSVPRRVLVVSLLVLGVLSVPVLAYAHPLGNFTINTSAAVIVRADEVVVDHAVDMAEIPTLQEQRRLDPDGDGTPSAEEETAYRSAACEDLRTGLRLQIDGAAAPLTLRSSSFSLPAGQAGLSTLRLRCVFATAIDPAVAHDLGSRIGPTRTGSAGARSRPPATAPRSSDPTFRARAQAIGSAPIRLASLPRMSSRHRSRSGRAAQLFARIPDPGRRRRRPAGSSPTSPLAPISRPASSP